MISKYQKLAQTKATNGLDGCLVDVIGHLANDYTNLIDNQNELLPSQLSYRIEVPMESARVERSARMAALQEMHKPLVKLAFDTRRFDQETTRNPRTNLQNWIRSEQFIDDETQGKVDIFAKILKPLEELKTSYGAQPEWHDSYVRVLYDHVVRILRIKQADLDIYQPQLAYLEQLMFARYRLSMDELSRMKDAEFKEAIMKKDEALLKRGAFLHATESMEKQSGQNFVMKDGNQKMTQESIVNAIFGNNDFRKAGEKTVERTITIVIRDNVIE